MSKRHGKNGSWEFWRRTSTRSGAAYAAQMKAMPARVSEDRGLSPGHQLSQELELSASDPSSRRESTQTQQLEVPESEDPFVNNTNEASVSRRRVGPVRPSIYDFMTDSDRPKKSPGLLRPVNRTHPGEQYFMSGAIPKQEEGPSQSYNSAAEDEHVSGELSKGPNVVEKRS